MTSSSPRSSHAAASAAGVIYQLERALFLLGTKNLPDYVVGVETDDDVASAHHMEQDKLSFMGHGHPFQERSINLWKTLNIWLKASTTNPESHGRAELHLVTNRPVPEGAFVREIDTAQDDKILASLVQRLRALGVSPRKDLSKHVSRVLSFTDQEIASVLKRIVLIDGSGGGGRAGMKEATIESFTLHPSLDAERVYDAMMGWLQSRLMDAWANKQAGWISRAEFVRQLNAVRSVEHRSVTIERSECRVPVLGDDRAAEMDSVFVRQLRSIDADDEEVFHAIEQFIRHRTEVLRLSATGDYAADDWSDFFDGLQTRWRRIWLNVKRGARRSGLSELDVGCKVYEDTVCSGWEAPLGERERTQPYLAEGGYHRLADGREVWWHPEWAPKPGDEP